MEIVEATIATINLDELLDRIERGQSVTITRHGNPVAQLVPISTSDNLAHQSLLRNPADLGAGRKLDRMSVREMINHGRRF